MTEKGSLRKYLDLAESGLSYDEIRDQIEADDSLDDETKRFYGGRVDRYLQRKAGSQVVINSNRRAKYLGLFVMGFGIFILAITYFTTDSFYVVPFGFILGGAALFFLKLNA